MKAWGFEDVTVTRGSGDGGVDVVAAHAVAQVKYQAKPVGRPAVQQLRGAAHGLDEALFFSWSGYSRQAIEYANGASVALFLIADDRPYPASLSAELILDAVRTRARERSAEQARKSREARRRRRQSDRAMRAARREQKRVARTADRRLSQQARDENRRISQQARDEKAGLRKARRAATLRAWRVALTHRYRQQRHAATVRHLERAGRRDHLGPPVVGLIRGALVLSLAGILLPFGLFSFLALRDALKAKRQLLDRGHTSSPRSLRAAAVISVLGLCLFAWFIVALVDIPFRSDPGELTPVAGALILLMPLAVTAGALYQWTNAVPNDVEGGPSGPEHGAQERRPF
jgi:hypothetical protein